MALHFSANVPSTSAVHVVVMRGSSVSYSFVCVCTTLTAMQSLRIPGNMHACVFLVCHSSCVLFPDTSLTSHLTLTFIALSSFVSGHMHWR